MLGCLWILSWIGELQDSFGFVKIIFFFPFLDSMLFIYFYLFPIGKSLGLVPYVLYFRFPIKVNRVDALAHESRG